MYYNKAMKKLILIDGNSLLNRAFYAMTVFTTKSGLPTNGIFGFLKLTLKIIEEEAPDYFAVAFDVHAPTFRHQMYQEYKGTRKGMPEELAVQVPVLKEVLSAMGICIVEKAGYEADDIIGTLSRAFPDVKTLIYTGDRDSFQLVNENVSVCFTKRGVSDLNVMTAENFFQKEGITPAQIIEQKSLMGDGSDNIPGVRGVGQKTAMDLLLKYKTLDNIYAHIDEIKGALQTKLTENKEMAYLSRQLATIDVNVPLEIQLSDCRLNLPFPEEAREYFAKLEFRSLVDGEYFDKRNKTSVQTIVCNDPEQVIKAVKNSNVFAFSCENDVHVYCDGKEFILRICRSLLDDGFLFSNLAPFFQRLFSCGARVIVSDLKELCHLMDGYDVSVLCPAEDVSLLRYLVDSNRRPAVPSELAKDFLLTEDNCAYALFKAYEEASEAVSGGCEEKIYKDVELPLVPVLLSMERTGVRVAEEKFSEFAAMYQEEMASLAQEIFRLAGVESFNLNSPFQLSDILFEKLGYPTYGAKKNIRGGYSTSAEVLEKLSEHYEIARLILRYREIQKLFSTYIEGIQPLVRNGIVHTTYHQTVTATGRLSSANPNLQNIPIRKESGRELRKLFVAREGNVLVDADYSQIELRLLAHFSGCKPLLEAYQTGKDIHSITASQVFDVPLEEVTSEQRRRAKAVNFGIIYGISAFGLAKDVGCTTTQAADYIARYFERYQAVKEYMDENVRKAKEDGFVTTILGRKRFIPELKNPNYNVRSFGERAAMNMPLQGSSADIIKIAMSRVYQRIKNEGLRAKLIMQVHDELVVDTPLDEVERVRAILKEEMEGAVALNVPLVVEVSVGESWYDAK